MNNIKLIYIIKYDDDTEEVPMITAFNTEYSAQYSADFLEDYYGKGNVAYKIVYDNPKKETNILTDSLFEPMKGVADVI